MFTNTDEHKRIVYLCAPKMTWLSIFKLKIFTFFHKDYQIALNMHFVKNIKENFLDTLKTLSNKKKLNIYNVSADFMMLLGLRNYDKYVNVYADETDFIENKRAIINRQFKIY